MFAARILFGIDLEINILKRWFIIIIPILVLIDQAIKIIVSKFFYDPHIHFPIIDGVFAFNPKQNIHLGWIWNMFDFMMPLYLAVLLSIVGIIIIIILYRYFAFLASNWDKYKKLPDIALIFLLSGAFCKLIDDIFWGGSLDYIQLFDWFIFDLKDVYITCIGVPVLIICEAISHHHYYKMSKEERREYKRKTQFFKHLKSGLPVRQ